MAKTPTPDAIRDMIAIPHRVLPAGLHYGVPAAEYHADPCAEPSLSSGVCRTLIEQTPAHAYLEHPRLGGHARESTPDMLFGSYVHALMAGDVSEFSVGDLENYQSKAAREWRDATVASGLQPILRHVVERAERVAAALREKAAAGITATPFAESAKSEVTGIWRESSGVWCRMRIDRLVADDGAYADVWDWKTTKGGVSDDDLTRTIIDHGYHVQAAFYLRGLTAICPEFAGRVTFILAFVEMEPPHAVRRVPICEGFLSLGHTLVERGIRLWKHCMDSKQWPDGHEQSRILTPPDWYVRKLEERSAA